MSGETFLSRWSKRKVAARAEESKPEISRSERVEEPVKPAPVAIAPSSPATPVTKDDGQASVLPPVESLTHESDFSQYLKSDVDPDVKNQAFKTMFKDPHYNVMDGLDIYIDDYGKPDPIPDSMLRKMTQSKLLRIFDDEDEEAEKAKQLAAGQQVEEAAVISATDTVPAVGQNVPEETNSLTPENVDESESQQDRNRYQKKV